MALRDRLLSSKSQMDVDHAQGVMLGLACGDALGRPVEFSTPEEIRSEYGQLRDMVGHGTWNQPAGTTTDDTEQALCIARSLVERGEFDPADITDRFVDWYDSGPFDIGGMTRRSLREIRMGTPWDEAGQRVWEQCPEGQNAGNGSVMRCAPLSIVYANDVQRLAEVSRQSSQITHADPRCTYGCAILNLTLAGLLRSDSAPLQNAIAQVRTSAPDELVKAVAPIAEGATLGELSTSGYVVHSLQTALNDGLTSDTTEEAIVTAVNRGGDADTIGAITGAIAGARFGAAQLPERWLRTIDQSNEIERIAEQLFELQLGQ